MFKTSFVHKTPTTEILIDVKFAIIEAKDLVKYQDKNKFESLCKVGCPNYNKKWACPPYSPEYSQYSRKYKFALVSIFSCDLNQFNYTKTEYMKIKASNSILKSKMDKLMRYLEPLSNGIMLSNGSCRLCKPCSCKSQSGPCKRPDKMRFSLEALGLDVGKISIELFDQELLWYKNKKAPSYSSVVSCLLTNTKPDEDNLKVIIKKST